MYRLIRKEARSLAFGIASEVDILSNIYLVLDIGRLAELLDRFDNPYQIWTVLTGFAWLGLDKNFAAWKELFMSVRKHFESFESFVIQRADLIREGHHDVDGEEPRTLRPQQIAISE